MRKHAFIVRWCREGRVVIPKLDSHASCVWPLGPEDNDVLSARALIAMIGHDDLPKEVKQFMHSYWGMTLRLRYSNGDSTGPYLINDDDGVHTAETIDDWLSTAPDEEIARYHHAARKVNALLNKKESQRGRAAHRR
jgi:hypothetical protein